MEEEVKMMQFGKRYRVGNFEFLKLRRALNKKEVERLRAASNIPKEVRNHLHRSALPYILVQTISGSWSVTYICGTTMYQFIEYELSNGEDGGLVLGYLFPLIYGCSTTVGDRAFYDTIIQAYNELMKRKESSPLPEGKDQEDLESVKTHEQAKEILSELGGDHE